MVSQKQDANLLKLVSSMVINYLIAVYHDIYLFSFCYHRLTELLLSVQINHYWGIMSKCLMYSKAASDPFVYSLLRKLYKKALASVRNRILGQNSYPLSGQSSSAETASEYYTQRVTKLLKDNYYNKKTTDILGNMQSINVNGKKPDLIASQSGLVLKWNDGLLCNTIQLIYIFVRPQDRKKYYHSSWINNDSEIKFLGL